MAFVNSQCSDDPKLREELILLLRSDGRESGIFSDEKTTNGIQFQLDTVVDSALPQQIGRYEVKRILGEGGMGVVYLAQQQNPHRDVAVKVIRSGTFNPDLLKRFEFEAAHTWTLDSPWDRQHLRSKCLCGWRDRFGTPISSDGIH